MLETRQVTEAILLFESILCPCYGSQWHWLPSIVWLPAFFKISSLKYQYHRTKKKTHTGNSHWKWHS